MQNDKGISVLNNLIETCKDGETGFKDAADEVKSPELKAKFNEYAQQRGEMAHELQTLVRGLGGDPETSGSTSGSMHRGWLNVKGAIAGKDDRSILEEAERGEDSAKSAYENALNEPLPSDAIPVVQQQAGRIRRAHDDVRNLRDSRKASD